MFYVYVSLIFGHQVATYFIYGDVILRLTAMAWYEVCLEVFVYRVIRKISIGAQNKFCLI